MTITPDLFAAFLKCPTKCWLRQTGEPASGNVYAEWVRDKDEACWVEGVKRMIAETPEGSVAHKPLAGSLKTATWRLSTDVVARTANTETRLAVVERMASEGQGKVAQFVPIRFVWRNKLHRDDKLLLAFDALALAETLGRKVLQGQIIHGDDQAPFRVKLPALVNVVRKLIEKIAALLPNPSPPDLVLNRHCSECEFEARCRKIAVEKDDLSLLARMTAKERQKFRSKGIFTVTQLSYTFRVRRRCKRWKSQQPDYSHALKALAVREKKIHVIGRPKITLSGTPVYLDVEGTVDDFYYLIGARTGGQQHFFWAESKAQERSACEGFLEFLAGIPDPFLVFYGRYERRFLGAMRQRYADLFDRFPRTCTAEIIKQSLNLLSAVYGKIYFPTYGNTLKELAKHCGFSWTASGASGLRALVWRAEWELAKDDHLMRTLLRYNAEDCEALELLTDLVTKLCQEDNLSPAALGCVRVEELKTAGPFLINKGGSALPEFKAINQAAYWDYQRLRVYVRTSKIIKKASSNRNRRMKSHIVRGTLAHPSPTQCPSCNEGELVRHARGSRSLVHDIKFLRHGAKAWVTCHTCDWRYCPRCERLVGPVLEHPFSLRKFGPTLRAYAVDQLIRLNIPGATIAKSLGGLFHYDLTGEHLSLFKADFAELYGDSISELTARITKGSLVHADETAARVVGKPAVVWVLTSMEEVVFLYAESREGEMVHKILSEFRGVLVSDSYSVYDSFDCPQQKCLIHLIRDFNDDLHRYPFDSELRQIASRFTGVLKPIVETIDQRGLTARFLAKHQPSVRQFLTWVTSQDFESETAQKFGQRFRKNREKFFTFMRHNGVPWNNNNAENAIRAFAALRERVGAHCTEKSLRHFLILLSISETCKRRGLSFFDFLCSGEKSLEGFAAGRPSRQRTKLHESARAGEKKVGHEGKGGDSKAQCTQPATTHAQTKPVMALAVPSPWDRFRRSAADEVAQNSKRSLKLERFDDVPFGGVVLAIPALMECGLWEQASDLFPTWIDRPFAEIAQLLVASMVLSRPANVGFARFAWPADWSEVLCKVRLPDACSLVGLINLIAKDRIKTVMWQSGLASKWISDASRLRAVLVVPGEQCVLLESPAIASSIDLARDALLARGLVEPWFRYLEVLPMLILMQTPSEGFPSAWKEWIRPQIKSILHGRVEQPECSTGAGSHQLTVVLAQGGVDLRFFKKMQRDGLQFFSYRVSADGRWPNAEFMDQEVEVQQGRREFVQTAERILSLAGGLPLREMQCACRNGLPLTIISSDRELDLHRIGARMASASTASRFLDRLRTSLAVVRSYGTWQGPAGTAAFGADPGINSFLGATVMVVCRAEAIMEQVLREKLPQPTGSQLALREILCERVDLVPVPGVNVLRILVHTNGDAGRQAIVAHLCSQLTATETPFPGTNLRLVYEPVRSQRTESSASG